MEAGWLFTETSRFLVFTKDLGSMKKIPMPTAAPTTNTIFLYISGEKKEPVVNRLSKYFAFFD